MQSTGFIDQSPDALQLTMIEGDFDPSQFTLLAGGKMGHEGIHVQATVIGASHIVRFDMPTFRFHEIFACVSVPGLPAWQLDKLMDRPVERQLPGMRYEFAVQRIGWEQEGLVELARLTAMAHRHCGGGGIGVVQEFPQGLLSAVPKTVIVGYTDVATDGIVLETAHSYPEQGLVLSRSSLVHTSKEVR